MRLWLSVLLALAVLGAIVFNGSHLLNPPADTAGPERESVLYFPEPVDSTSLMWWTHRPVLLSRRSALWAVWICRYLTTRRSVPFR